MKKGKLLRVISEAAEATKPVNMNQESFFDGHKFVEYGKNIKDLSFIYPSEDAQEFTLNKDKFVIKWAAKFEFRNAGVDGVQVQVIDMEGSMTAVIEGEKQEVPINFGEFEITIATEKNIESPTLQMYVQSVEIDAELKKVAVIVSI